MTILWSCGNRSHKHSSREEADQCRPYKKCSQCPNNIPAPQLHYYPKIQPKKISYRIYQSTCKQCTSRYKTAFNREYRKRKNVRYLVYGDPQTPRTPNGLIDSYRFDDQEENPEFYYKPINSGISPCRWNNGH